MEAVKTSFKGKQTALKSEQLENSYKFMFKSFTNVFTLIFRVFGTED